MVSLDSKYRAVFLSPHLDDAVFSCSGEIQKLSKEGKVIVVNVFTNFPTSTKRGGVVLGPERYLEEASVASFLKFDHLNLGDIYGSMIDASLRHKHYKTLSNIFRSPYREDLEQFGQLEKNINDILETISFDTLYVPLGVGWHVDHELVFRVGKNWSKRKNVLFYEDVPYCLLNHAVDYRLRQLGVEVEQQHLGAKCIWETTRSFKESAMMRNVGARLLQHLVDPFVSIYLWRLIRGHLKKKDYFRLNLKPEVHQLDENAFKNKVEAMMLYKSQFREFFLGYEDCYEKLSQYAIGIKVGETRLERYWRLITKED